MAGGPISVHLKHVRSFAEAQDVPVRPLTLLVGENSSGKSTFLAVAACVFGRRPLARPGFNEPPYNLGTFETIATYKGGKYGRDESFTIGYSVGDADAPGRRSVRVTYRQERGNPWLEAIEVTDANYRIHLRRQNGDLRGELLDSSVRPAKKMSLEATGELADSLVRSVTLDHLGVSSVLLMDHGDREDAVSFTKFHSLNDAFSPPFDSVASIAPIRTKPRRTYDDLAEDHSPEGDHIPKVLARLLSDESSSKPASQIKEALQRFGKESGLFKEISVRKLGKGPSDPFQVQVASNGPKVNVVDVGYGVSQALPVLVQTTLHGKNSLQLIQQPEVHLHPRAQAALGTFFAELAALGRGTYVVETHSDHLIDRVRLEVARGTLKPEQVQILYFHRPKFETTVYPINLDALGNVEDAPECYREFFLQEQLQLLTRGEA